MTVSRRAFLAAATAMVAAGCLPGREQGSIRLAAGDNGGLYLAICEILARRVQVRYPGIEVTVLPSAGSAENLALVRSGQVDMGLAQADLIERDQDLGPRSTAPHAVARIFENYLQLVVPADSTLHKLDDLAGLRVSCGLIGSGVAATSTVLFTAAQLNNRIRVANLSLHDALRALGGHQVDALVWSGGVPTPAITDLNTTLPLRILDLTPWVGPMSRLAAYPYLLLRAPAGAYVPPDIRTIGTPDILVSRPGLPNHLVRAIVDVLASDTTALMPPDVRGLQYLNPPSMIQTGRIPLHPGAVEAYRALHG